MGGGIKLKAPIKATPVDVASRIKPPKRRRFGFQNGAVVKPPKPPQQDRAALLAQQEQQAQAGSNPYRNKPAADMRDPNMRVENSGLLQQPQMIYGLGGSKPPQSQLDMGQQQNRFGMLRNTLGQTASTGQPPTMLQPQPPMGQPPMNQPPMNQPQAIPQSPISAIKPVQPLPPSPEVPKAQAAAPQIAGAVPPQETDEEKKRKLAGQAL